jgi:rubredoxin
MQLCKRCRATPLPEGQALDRCPPCAAFEAGYEQAKLEQDHAKELEHALADVDAYKTKLAEAQVRLKEVQSRTPIECVGSLKGSKNGCHKKVPAKELIYLQTHWYTRPHGCTGGDYWNQGEGQFKCPNCGVINRLYDRKDVEALRYVFKEIKDTYDKE